MGLTDSQRTDIRTQLLEERRRILFNVDALKAEFGSTMTDETEEHGLESHLADQGTDTFLRERDLSLADHEMHLLAEIDAAIARLDTDAFGVCEVKGEPIPYDRLTAQPWARTCIEHATT